MRDIRSTLNAMNATQIEKTIRTLEGELKELDLQRGTLIEAIASLRRLVPLNATNGSAQQGSEPKKYPGLTDGILAIVEEGAGRPVPVKTIRDKFRGRGWLYGTEGQDRSKTIYETLRRLTRKGRLQKVGKRGYIIPGQDSPGDPRKGDLLGLARPERGGL